MALDNISLGMRYDGYDHEGYNGILFHQHQDAANGDRDVRLVFSSMLGTDAQSSFDVTCTYHGHRKGGMVETSPTSVTVRVQASSAHPVESGGRWWWSIPLKTIASGLTGATWTYAGRTWDGIELDFSIVCNWTGAIWEGLTRSPAYTQTCYINYVPTYTLSGIYTTESGDLGITYSATDWGRPDDRWGIDEGKVDGRDAFLPNTWGTVSGYGRVVVPRDRITRDLTTGQLTLRLRFNAAWRPASMEFATISTKMANTSDPHRETQEDPGVRVNDWSKADPSNRAYRANTPVLSVEPVTEEGACILRVGVRDSGDLGRPITHAIVKLQGARYSFDSADVRMGATGYLFFPPVNVPFRVFAYGLDGNGGVSDSAVVAVKPIDAGGALMAVVDDPTTCLRIGHRKDGGTLLPTVTTEANVEKVQLSGRRRQSVYFGEGGKTSVKFSGWVVGGLDDPAEANSIDYNLMEEPNATAYEEFPEMGVFMCRFQDGRRYAVEGSVSIDPDGAGDYEVSVDAEEVDA